MIGLEEKKKSSIYIERWFFATGAGIYLNKGQRGPFWMEEWSKLWKKMNSWTRCTEMFPSCVTLAVTVFPSYISDFVEYFVWNSGHGEREKKKKSLKSSFISVSLFEKLQSSDLRLALPTKIKTILGDQKWRNSISLVALKEKNQLILLLVRVICVVPRWDLQPRSSVFMCC